MGKSSENTKKSPTASQAPSAALKRVDSGGRSPPERRHRVEAIEVSEFATAFASYIEGDTGVFIIPIVIAGTAGLGRTEDTLLEKVEIFKNRTHFREKSRFSRIVHTSRQKSKISK